MNQPLAYFGFIRLIASVIASRLFLALGKAAIGFSQCAALTLEVAEHREKAWELLT